jgi:hypothetical protein
MSRIFSRLQMIDESALRKGLPVYYTSLIK